MKQEKTRTQVTGTFGKISGAFSGLSGKSVRAYEIHMGSTVAVSYIHLRKSNDYVPKMIDIAGGEYVFRNLKGEDNAASSVNMPVSYTHLF